MPGEADAHAGYGIASCSSRPRSVASSTPWPPAVTRSSRSRASSSPSTRSPTPPARRPARSARCRSTWPSCCARTAPRSCCTSRTQPRCGPTRWCPTSSRSTAARSSSRASAAAAAAARCCSTATSTSSTSSRAATGRSPTRSPPTIRDGRLYGRGACDMKGGVASMVVAACTLAELGVPLAGDLIVNTVTEEESTGAGGLFAARLLAGRRGDRPGAERPRRVGRLPRQPAAAHHRARPRRPRRHPPAAARAGRRGQRDREDGDRARGRAPAARALGGAPAPPLPLAPATACRRSSRAANGSSPTRPSCTLECHIEYLPDRADEHGYGALVEREFSDWIAEAAAADPWLREHPPEIVWGVGGVPPAEVADGRSDRAGAARRGRRPRPDPASSAGLDNWHDGATLTVEAGIPAVCFGPGDVHRAHTADEYVPIDDLVACAQRIALAAMRFCG